MARTRNQRRTLQFLRATVHCVLRGSLGRKLAALKLVDGNIADKVVDCCCCCSGRCVRAWNGRVSIQVAKRGQLRSQPQHGDHVDLA